MKRILWLVAVTVAGWMAAPDVSALPTLTLDRIAGHYTGEGGEFTLYGTPFLDQYAAAAEATGAYGTGFQSFCLEKDEYVSLPGVYNYQINSAAVGGGVSGGSPDPLSMGTAWLYSQFAMGTLANYTYAGSGRTTSAGKLQATIWWLEGELGDPGSANIFRQMVLGRFGTAAAAMNSAPVGYMGVHVLNLTQGSERKQDQLVKIPDGGLTAALLGVALVGCGALRRRFA
jgi:hypothetical protein